MEREEIEQMKKELVIATTELTDRAKLETMTKEELILHVEEKEKELFFTEKWTSELVEEEHEKEKKIKKMELKLKSKNFIIDKLEAEIVEMSDNHFKFFWDAQADLQMVERSLINLQNLKP